MKNLSFESQILLQQLKHFRKYYRILPVCTKTLSYLVNAVHCTSLPSTKQQKERFAQEQTEVCILSPARGLLVSAF